MEKEAAYAALSLSHHREVSVCLVGSSGHFITTCQQEGDVTMATIRHQHSDRSI
jgi:hypothetical protein